MFEKIIEETVRLKGLAIISTVEDFGAFQKLLSASIEDSSLLLVLNCPEAALHPIYQVKYAEQLIKLIKENPIPIIVISHSPYFIEAIEIFSNEERKDIKNRINFYIMEEIEGEFVHKVSHDLSSIYEDFAKPFKKLEEIERKDAL